MPEYNINAVMTQFIRDSQRRLFVQIWRLQASLKWRQRLARQQLVEILREFAAIAVNIQQPGDTGEDVLIRAFPLNLRQDTLFSAQKHMDLAPFATLSLDHTHHQALLVAIDKHITHIEIAHLLAAQSACQTKLDHVLPVAQADLLSAF